MRQWIIVLLAGLALLACSRTGWTAEGKAVHVKNAYYDYVFDCSDGLKLTAIENVFTKSNILNGQPSPALGVIDIGQRRWQLDRLPVTKVEQTGERTMIDLGNNSIGCRLTIATDSSPETHWTLSVENRTTSTVTAKVSFPVLTGLMAGEELEQVEYYHGHDGGIFGRDPVFFRGMYGFASPVMDLYIKRLGGLYLIVKDEKQGLKGLDLVKKVPGWLLQPARQSSHNRYAEFSAEDLYNFDRGCAMAVTFRQVELAPNAQYVTPPVALGVHPGRWEKAWESYAAWLKTVITPRPIPDWWRQAFISKSLFQENYHPKDTYDWNRCINPFDGPHSVFTLNHWMNNRGDYQIRTDWGGPEAFRKALAELRARGIHSDLYTEGFQVAKNSEAAKEHGNRWAVLQDGRRLDDGQDKPGEWFYCPGSGWQDLYPQIGSRVIRESDGDVLYLDSVAIRFHLCEDTTHDHPYRDGYHVNVREFLTKTAQALDKVKPGVPFFSELWSTDINAQIPSGCYSNAVHNAVDMTEKGMTCAKTGTHLLRFFVPQVKFIEIVDEEEEEIGLSLFNGNAVHQSFNKMDLWPFFVDCVRVWGGNARAFASDHPEALIETSCDNIQMNKFPADGKAVYTLWNSSYQDAVDQPIEFKAAPGRHYVELFAHKELKPKGDTLPVSLAARRCGAFADLPQILSVRGKAEGSLHVGTSKPVANGSLSVLARVRGNRGGKVLFEDTFDGTGGMDPQKWTVSDGSKGQRTGHGTALVENGTNWLNRKNGLQWDYTKPHTVEVAFRLGRRPHVPR